MNDNGKNELLDQTAFDPLSNQEKQVMNDAARAGGSLDSDVSAAELARHIGAGGASGNLGGGSASNQTGVANQTINPSDLGAATESGALAGDTDLTGGVANLDATTNAPVEQNDYNR